MVRHGQKTKIKNARKGYTQDRYDRDDGQSASRSKAVQWRLSDTFGKSSFVDSCGKLNGRQGYFVQI